LRHQLPLRRVVPWAAILLATLLTTSCQRGDRKPVVRVTGSFFFQGRPAQGARVAFHPSRDPRDRGLCPQGVVAADGSFQLTTYTAADGAPPGDYVITVYWPAPGPDDDVHVHPDRLGGHYADLRTTPLTATVPGKAVDLDRFDLK
jgi:hypothetical protein